MMKSSKGGDESIYSGDDRYGTA
ncbi:hypothetical protein A2U01_0115597, partial [Trifolium medium]|nr:hypothetical protein [Trifolium medium]